MSDGYGAAYQRLLKIRKKTDLKLAPNAYLKPEYTLRYYQSIGTVHMYMVKRFVLGDDCGLGKCQVASTKVVTPRGVVRLDDKSLWRKEDFTNRKKDTFYDTPRGTKLASDGVKDAPKIYSGGVKPTIKFRTKLGTHAQPTHNHRWKVMMPTGDIKWVKTKDLKKGDSVAVGRGQNVWGYKSLEKDEAWLLGFIIGDGSYNRYTDKQGYEKYALSITNTDSELIERCVKASSKYFNNSKNAIIPPRRVKYLEQTKIWESGSENVKELFSRYGLEEGETAEFKTIPGIIKGSNKTTFCHFLQGLFDADGYISGEGTIELTLATKDLIEDIQLYLLNMGIVASVTEKYNKEYQRYYYNLRILEVGGKKKFSNWIGFSCTHKKERLDKSVNLDRISNQTRDIIPHQHRRVRNISNTIPKNKKIKWVFKDILKSRHRGAGNLSYECAFKIISLEEYMPFLLESKDFQELKEIVDLNYFYTEITEIEDGGMEEVFDLSVPDGNTYIANGMVSHNTLQTIATYTTLLAKNPDQKLMIICPSSAMYQWASEFDKFCTGITSQIVESTTIKHVDGVKLKCKDYLTSFNAREYQFKQFLQNKNNVVIFNYNTMCSDGHVLKKLLADDKYMIVFDEATAFKNNKSMTSEHAKVISRIAERVYGLSATIIKNNLIEAWSIYDVIMPGLFGSYTAFKKNYCIVNQKQLWKGKGKAGKLVSEVIGFKNVPHFKKTIDPFFLGRKKAEVAKDLPEIVSREIKIKMHPKQQSLYDDALDGLIDYEKYSKPKFKLEHVKRLIQEDSEGLETRDPKLIDKLTSLIYCQQIANSPRLIDIDVPSAKEDEMINLLKDDLAGEKVVIYTRFKKMVNRLEYLITTKLKLKCTKITGEVKSRDREVNKVNFNTSEDCNIMIINSAAKEAINLQSSGYLVFYDLPFSYGDFLQIIGRIHRIGSTHDKIFLFYMMCIDSVDEKTYDILVKKKELFDEVLGDSAVGAIHNKTAEIVNDLFDKMLESKKG